jgi:hypothetical protein
MPAMPTETHKSSFLERHPELKLTPEQLRERNARLLATIEKFMEGDEAEQRDTGTFLMNALAQARESNRDEKRQ